LATQDRGAVSVIDDDASLRRALRNLLSSVGLEVETFESAEAFLKSEDRESAGCLVLDLQLPGMSGLELLTHLTASGSRHRIIILTAHGEEGARQRSLRAGAFAFLEKPFHSTELLDAVQRALSTFPPEGDSHRGRNHHLIDSLRGGHLRASDRTIQFACGTLNQHRHVCAFFNGHDEEHRVLSSFIREGLDGGEKGFHIVDPDLRDDHLKRLAGAGIDVEQTIASGQLEVVPWQEAHLRGGRFEQDTMLAMVEEVLQSSAAAGYPLTRIVAQMEWALLDYPGVDDLLEYETRVNYVLPKYDDLAICTYDLSKFSASVAMDIMRTHPMVIIGGVLQENPFFVPPDQFLLEIRERRLARQSASTAR
jgi:FixJ family two-component response regulator